MNTDHEEGESAHAIMVCAMGRVRYTTRPGKVAYGVIFWMSTAHAFV